MSIQKITVTLECDVCWAVMQIEVTSLADAETQLDTVRAEQGWWTRTDAISDVCPKHPRLVGGAA